MSSIESEKDKWGDKMFFVHDEDQNLYWINNYNDCHLDRTQMEEFLEKCLDYLKEAEE